MISSARTRAATGYKEETLMIPFVPHSLPPLWICPMASRSHSWTRIIELSISGKMKFPSVLNARKEFSDPESFGLARIWMRI